MAGASPRDFSTAGLFDLRGRTALVTGGSSGIGLEMAKGLPQNGARVIIASRSRKKLDAALVELGPRNITVNAVAPGFFASRMTRFVFERYLADIEADCPLGRIGEPEEIVGVVTYLASRAGSHTTGVVIPVDGGTSISKGRRDWMNEN